MSAELTYFTDPGHGWLRVPLAELDGFQPSEYSYRDAEFAYLEEDCDAFGWAVAVGRVEDAQNATVAHTNRESTIRNKARF